ncbi:MAG: ATP-binding cassette domain-containing protein [Erysipelotrichaceae bacterium]|nr:ATP-binding cassette domain-containing protein [Erysipelotrichaceae bacterium]
MIEFKNVSFSYEDSPTLHNVDFKMEDGQFIGILGPNGGGKSTFLKLTLGLLSPASGTLTVTDKKIAYLSQTTSTSDRDFQCTVEELVSLGAISGKKLFLDKKDKAKVKKTLEDFGLYPLRKRLINELSGGQLQRVRVAKALVGDPSLLVFDEPDAGMDEENHHNLIHLIEDLHEQGKSILFVSHHPHDLEKADAIYFIEDGKILTYQEELERGHHHVSL